MLLRPETMAGKEGQGPDHQEQNCSQSGTTKVSEWILDN